MTSTLVSALMATVSAPLNEGKDEEVLKQLKQANNAADERATHQTVSTAKTSANVEGANSKRKRPGLPIHSFNHLSKETENVDEMVRFYTKVMGFRRIKRPPFPFAGAWLFMPPSTALHIIEKDPSVDLPEGPCAAVKKMGNWQEVAKNPASLKRGHHMAFRTEDLALTMELLKEYGIKFAENVVPQTGQRQLFFFDPDGNGIEICDCDVDPPPFMDELEDEDDADDVGQNDGGRAHTEASSTQHK
jgi:catechol 2,3-dioxygenase-like lactoylglutathione lyase family enzyme